MITVRSALPEEISFIRDQRVNAYEEHAGKISHQHWNGLKRAISSGADQEDGTEIIVAVLEGTIVGSVVLCPENTDAYRGLVGMSEYPEIRMLAVEWRTRGKGIASLLIKECVRRSKERGCSYVGLHTAPFMDSAMRLYQKMGFTHIPEYDFEPADDGVIVKAFRKSI